MWGRSAGHMREEVIRMVTLIMHAFRPPDGPWLVWHIRLRMAARGMVNQACGAPPATAIVASAVARYRLCALAPPARSWVARRGRAQRRVRAP